MQAAPIKAVQYIRMSSLEQRYSVHAQTATNAAYAQEHGVEITGAFLDRGRSGLTLRGRPGFQALLDIVLSGRADFRVILVVDVSRWGRFQDPDEGAHYEFLCRQAGVRVIYTGELFEGHIGLDVAILKQLKRAMAAEAAREMGRKVSAALRGLGAKGYWMGGRAPFGYQRWSLQPSGRMRRLEDGEVVKGAGRRTVLRPGPPEHVATIRRIFWLFTREGQDCLAIARTLDLEAIEPPRPGGWGRGVVEAVLRQERYIGECFVDRTSTALLTRTARPRAQWRKVAAPEQRIVSRRAFHRAQRRLRDDPGAARRARSGPAHGRAAWAAVPDDVILHRLCELRLARGRLRHDVVADDPFLPGLHVLARRFGSFRNACILAGDVRKTALSSARIDEQLRAATWRGLVWTEVPQAAGVTLQIKPVEGGGMLPRGPYAQPFEPSETIKQATDRPGEYERERQDREWHGKRAEGDSAELQPAGRAGGRGDGRDTGLNHGGPLATDEATGASSSDAASDSDVCSYFVHPIKGGRNMARKSSDIAGDRLEDNANRVAEWRECRGLTQAKLAEMIQTTGSVVSLLEAGHRQLSPKWLRRISVALGVPIGRLLEGPGVDAGAAELLEVWARLPASKQDEALRVLRALLPRDAA